MRRTPAPRLPALAVAALAAGLVLGPAGPRPAQAAAILPGNTTDVALAAAPVLAGLGVAASPLGAATLDASGAVPVVRFPITGGTAGPGGALVILHEGSGLALTAAGGAPSAELRNFVVDTAAAAVTARVLVNGSLASPALAVFDLSPSLALTLTAAAAGALNGVFGVTAFAEGTPIGTAATTPLVAPVPAPASLGLFLAGLAALAAVGAAGRGRGLGAAPTAG